MATTAYWRAHNALPRPAITDDRGTPLSADWRMAILPELGQRGALRQVQLRRAVGENNKALLKEMPAIFSCPGRSKARAVHRRHTA